MYRFVNVVPRRGDDRRSDDPDPDHAADHEDLHLDRHPGDAADLLVADLLGPHPPLTFVLSGIRLAIVLKT